MNSLDVVVGDIVEKKSMQVTLIEHDHVICQFSLARSHPAFGGPILPGAPECRSLRIGAQALNRSRDIVGKDGVVRRQHVRADFALRMEPADVIEALEALHHEQTGPSSQS